MVSPGTLPLSIIRGITFGERILRLSDETVSVSVDSGPVSLYLPSGTFSGYDLFVWSGSPSWFLYYNPLDATYVISLTLTEGALTNYFLSVGLTEPTGTYAGQGTYAGSTATATDHPIDLTGSTVEAKVRRTPKSEEYIDLNPSVTDAVNGEITIPAMTKAETFALENIGDFQWDLVRNTGALRSGPYVKGAFTISDNISQISVPPA